MVVLGWFTQQGSVSTGQPGAPYLPVLLAQCAVQLPSKLQEGCGLHSLASSHLNTKGRLKEPLSQVKDGSILSEPLKEWWEP